ncbi:MAG: protein-export chaperone SecB [Gemmatimonadaceae bacterium]|nr:protein-export chaperone SecB [Gemmatimonadaceae bacterium]
MVRTLMKRGGPTRKEEHNASSSPPPAESWTIPDFQLQVRRAPWTLGGVNIVFARYQETLPEGDINHSPEAFSINTTIRVKMEWSPTRDLLLFMHAEVVSQGAPVVVNCEVIYRMRIERPSKVPDSDVFDFARTIGVRALFPYVRAAVANISSQGSIGSINLQPANLDVILHEPDERHP